MLSPTRARPLRGQRVVDPVKFLEDAFAVLRRHARPAVQNAELGAPGGPRRERDCHLAAARGIFAGVVEQVDDDLLEGVAVCGHGERPGGKLPTELEPGFREPRRVRVEQAGEFGAEIERLLRVFLPALFEAAEIEGIVHQAGEALGFPTDGAQVFAALRVVGHASLFEQLGVEPDRGQRGLEFVRHVGDEGGLCRASASLRLACQSRSEPPARIAATKMPARRDPNSRKPAPKEPTRGAASRNPPHPTPEADRRKGAR